MTKLFHYSQLRDKKPPILQAFIVLFSALLAFVAIGPLIGFQIAAPIFGGSQEDLQLALQNPSAHDNIQAPLFIIQGIAATIGLILVPWLFIRYDEKIPFLNFFQSKNFADPMLSLVVFLMVVSFMGCNALLIQWNAQLSFPEFMKGFEKWIVQREAAAAELTALVTDFEHIGPFMVGILVIAIIPAIGEELLFRGLLQNYFQKAFRNPHLAIWLSAILFSAVHLQFLGFFPRMTLGALFGYLYLWSRNLYFPILAHFINNGFTLLMLYLFQSGYISVNIQETETVPWPWAAIALVLTSALVYFFHRSLTKNYQEI